MLLMILIPIIVGGLLLCGLGNDGFNAGDSSGLPGCIDVIGRVMLILATGLALALMS